MEETESNARITWHVQTRLDNLLVDDSSIEPSEVAIYTLSDPRNIRQARYMGKTTAPRRQYLQHVSQVRLWLPDEAAL